MPLIPMRNLMRHALAKKYAVGYFEAWNMESLQAVVNAAEETNSPVIIGFGGQFVGSKKRKVKENIYHYGHLGSAMAKHSKVPVALLLNEAHEVSLLMNGLKSGFNAIMLEGNGMPASEFIEINKYLVKTAHYFGADVEAEVGKLPDSDISNNTINGGKKTDVDEAINFVKETGIDALAVAVGNVHLLENKKVTLDFDLIATLRKKIPVPLVLHGGTGIAFDELEEAIRLGVCKVNVGTVLKRAYLDYIQSYLKDHNVKKMDPHNVIGRGGEEDMLCGAREAVTDVILGFMKILGCENKAKLI
jgi:ketose-bisphosphate aldolase